VGVLLNQLAAVLATGNRPLVLTNGREVVPAGLPNEIKERIQVVQQLDMCTTPFQVALVDSSMVASVRPQLAARDGALAAVIDTTEEGEIALWRLVAERALCVNTTAAGGNASLMTLGL
jgi:RHH-type proline utilization regulon transcriptional repressor/proline dehydrogenase/delta 1-pyrroline-5-carboxylate dehydrogenase